MAVNIMETYAIIEERYEGTPNHNGVINVSLPLTNDVCQIHWGQYIGTKTKEGAIANAKLIAAAPELLEVIKQFIHAVEHEGVINGRVVDAVRNGKEVIKKATA